MRKENFKLERSTKRFAAGMNDKVQRNEFIKMMIDAQISADQFRNSRSRSEKNTDSGDE